MWRGEVWGTNTIEYSDDEEKGVNLTLISTVLSKTQLDFTQLNNPIF